MTSEESRLQVVTTMTVRDLMDVATIHHRGQSFAELLALARSRVVEVAGLLAGPAIQPGDLWRDRARGDEPSGVPVLVADALLASLAACAACLVPLGELERRDAEHLGREIEVPRDFQLEWWLAPALLARQLELAVSARSSAAGEVAANLLEALGAAWRAVAARPIPDSAGELLARNVLPRWSLAAICLWRVRWSRERELDRAAPVVGSTLTDRELQELMR